jgi:hypothetical protein
MQEDYVSIASSPANEPCAQVGADDYYPRAQIECRALIGQLRRMHGEEPVGAKLGIKANSHEFGTYHDVVCYYDINNDEAANYAFNCEDLPEQWDDEAKAEISRKLAKAGIAV